MNKPEIKACTANEWKPSPLDVAVEEIYAITGQYSKPNEGWPESRVKQYIRDVIAAYHSAGNRQPATPETGGVKALASASGSAATLELAIRFCVAHRDDYEDLLNSDSADIDAEFMSLCHAVFGQPVKVNGKWQPNDRTEPPPTKG